MEQNPMDQVVSAMDAYDYDKYTAADVKEHWHMTTYTGRFSGAVVTGSTAASGRDCPGSAEGDKKTFWKQCLYVHTDLYCKLL